MLQAEVIDHVLDWAAGEQLPTPLRLFAPASVREAAGRLREQLGARISYATKANPHPWMLAETASLVDEFNVTNVEHLDALLRVAVDPQRAVFINPVPTPAALSAVLERGVTRFVLDDARGLRLLRERGAETRLRVTLRLMPPDLGQSTRSVVRFGTTPEAVHELAQQAVDAGIEVESLSFFVGTAGHGMGAARPYQDGMEQLAKVRERLAGDGIEVPTVTIGGGFPGARRRFFLDHPDFFGRITALIAEYVGAEVPVVAEPGRYLAEPSTAMLTRVIADRAPGGRRLVHLDSSAFAGLFETTFIGTEEAPLAVGVRSGDRGEATPVQLLGPIMDSFDVVARDVPAPPLAEGELLFLPNVGAYSVGYAARCEGMREPELVRLPAGLDDELAAACLDVAAS